MQTLFLEVTDLGGVVGSGSINFSNKKVTERVIETKISIAEPQPSVVILSCGPVSYGYSKNSNG